MTAPPSGRGFAGFVANIGNKLDVVLLCSSRLIAATCYAILSPLLPARMSPGMQLTAEVPAWLSSVARIVVRYANKKW